MGNHGVNNTSFATVSIYFGMRYALLHLTETIFQTAAREKDKKKGGGGGQEEE